MSLASLFGFLADGISHHSGIRVQGHGCTERNVSSIDLLACGAFLYWRFRV